MKVFAIKNEDDFSRKDLAYLIYYENDRCFYIEIPEDADEWEIPMILSSFIKRGIMTVDAYWSKQWVMQRIVPPDRQNLGQILKENGLSEYDEYSLLILSGGRCAQDSYYIEPLDESVLEKMFGDRYERKIDDIIPGDENNLIVFFRNGTAKKCDIKAIAKEERKFAPVLNSKEVFRKAKVETGGYGVSWGEVAVISDKALYDNGVTLPLSKGDFISFVSERIISSADAAKIINCSRQNINELVKNGKLHPVKTEQKTTFFMKSEIEKRMWK